MIIVQHKQLKDDNDILGQIIILYTKSTRLFYCFTVVLVMLNLLYFAVTVFDFIAHFCGRIMRSQLTDDTLHS